MATPTKTPISQGLISRVVSGARYALSGKVDDAWFGPQQPMAPLAPPDVAGRQLDYPVGYNLVQTPRAYEQITFAMMRGLADSYDLLRILIETRKDQVCNLRWSIAPRDEKKQPDSRCETIQEFLRSPDQEHGWQEWLRMLLEDMLVIDAATIYPRPTRGGGLYSLELVDGATIKRVLDVNGRTPLPPDPAYQQVLKGVPAVDYSRDELVYAPRNPRTSRVYGYSPVEQIIMTVNIALRRQAHQLEFYTEGTMPEALIGVPAEWNPDQIKQFQGYFDALLTGNTGERRRARFVPAGFDVFETKAGALKDEYDEWLARVCCFAFSIEPTPFVKQTNRATSDTAREQSLAEGLEPVKNWLATLLSDRIIAKCFGAPDLCFTWDDEEAIDPFVQAQINQIYLTTKVLTPDEVRVDTLGKPALTPEEREALNPPPPVMMPGDPNDPNAPPTGKPIPDTDPKPKPDAPPKPKPDSDPKPGQTTGKVDEAADLEKKKRWIRSATTARRY